MHSTARFMVLVLLVPGFGCDVQGSGVDASTSSGSDTSAGSASDAAAVGGPSAGAGSPKIRNTFVSGFAFDGKSGKPVGGVTITTEPPLGVLTTSQQGAYVIDAGQAFGRLTLRATKDGFVQRDAGCVTLKPGQSVIADLTLAAVGGGASNVECVPACGAASTCAGGVCVTRCNPSCSCNERCSSGGACEPDPEAPPAGECEAHALALGGGVCECEAGYVPTGDGRSCSAPKSVSSCPAGAALVETAIGQVCACTDALVPNASGEACVDSDDAAVVLPFEETAIRARIDTPGPAPRGIASDGARLWVGDAAQGAVLEVNGPGQFDLGPDGYRIVDIAAVPDALLVVIGALTGSDTDELRRIDLDSGAVTTISANDFEPAPGVSFDGTDIVSVEGGRLVHRSLGLGQIRAYSTIELGKGPSLSVTPGSRSDSVPAAFLGLTGNRALVWEGSTFDGLIWWTQIAVLNAAHPTRAARVDSLRMALGGSTLRGIEADADTAWFVIDGVGVEGGPALPAVVEVGLE